MSDRSHLYLQDWSAFAPGLHTRTQWCQWLASGQRAPAAEGDAPVLARVPAMIRRRCTPLTRMVLEVCYDLAERLQLDLATEDVVFASRFGEIKVLESLFGDMFRQEAMSPVDFCNSVHHTPTGYLSMATGNRGISRTVCAMESTLGAGLLETGNLLYDTGRTHGLLVVADELVPDLFGGDESFFKMPFSVAMRFGKEPEGGGRVSGLSVDRILHMMSTGQPDMNAFFKEFLC